MAILFIGIIMFNQRLLPVSVSLVLMSCSAYPVLPVDKAPVYPVELNKVGVYTQPTPSQPINQSVNRLPNQNVPNQPNQYMPNQPIVNQHIVVQPVPQTSRNYGDFNEWKSDFIDRTSRNYNASLTNQLLQNATLNESVIRLDNNQAEFAKMPWEYLNSAVSSSKIKQGQAKRQSQFNLLMQNENTYGVPASIVTAIWGIESSFGSAMGNTDLPQALASLAYDGRRREFAEEQLKAMMTMIERGDVQKHTLKGSWAGGMGHTQFIPTTWLTHGVDGDFDGKKNPWSTADALTSTANYLAKSGWVRGLPAYIEVRLPANIAPNSLNYYLSGKQTLDTWRNLGLVSISGENLLGTNLAELWFPAGISGPAILTTQNFDVIKVYNNSSSYALAVAALANGINNRPTIMANFPTFEKGLSRTQISQLQQRLTSQGYDTKGVDGVAGANTRRAFARWQADNGRFADGFISQNTAMGLY